VRASSVNVANKNYRKNFFGKWIAFNVARMAEHLLRIARAKLNYDRKNFFTEIATRAWPGVVAQRGANSNADAQEIFFFFEA